MYRLRQLTVMLGDLIFLYVGFYLAIFLRYLDTPNTTQLLVLLTPLTQLFLLFTVIFFIVGLYDLGRLKNNWTTYQKILLGCGVWLGLGIIYFYLHPTLQVSPKTILLIMAGLNLGLISLWRYIHSHHIMKSLWQIGVLFIGTTPETNEIIQFLKTQPERGYFVLGVIPLNSNPETNLDIPTFNSLSELGENLNPGLIVIAPNLEKNDELIKKLYAMIFQHVSILDLEQFYEELMKRIPPFTFSQTWFLSNLREQHKKIYDRFRIVTDYLIAVIIGGIFVITFPLVALLLKIFSPGPIFFIHERIGRMGQKFRIIKYRSMKVLGAGGSAEVSGPVYAKEKDERITKIGKILRLTRLDEIPQFINILKGEMAIIGPRPERPEFVEELTKQMPYYSLRHMIKPGLTGWAQLQKNYYGTMEENLRKLEYDLYYIKNRSLLLDIVILLRTINVIFGFKGR